MPRRGVFVHLHGDDLRAELRARACHMGAGVARCDRTIRREVQGRECRYMSPTARRMVPGDLMLHPVVVASVVLLLANDHVFKLRWPSVVTGKVSDVAGLVFFPVLLFSFAELCSAVLHRRAPSPAILVGCIFVTGIAFASAEVAPNFERVLEAIW